MAAQARLSVPNWQERRLDMRSLRRLAIWGTSATVALTIAVIAGYSDLGARRSMVASGGPGNGPKADARTPEMEADTQRLAGAVRILTADREQLVARIGTLERNLEEITGSIKRQDPAAGAAALPAPPSGSAATPPAASPSPSKDATAQPPSQPSTPERLANAPAAATEEPPAIEPLKGEFGVDVGGAGNFEGLRVLWTAAKGSNGTLFEGLHPAVAVRENSKAKSAELRLIVGPLADVEAAARLCAALSAARHYCQPVAFEGQRLADADVAVEHKPAAAAKPPPKSATKPAAKPSASGAKFPRLF
jgi:hypothetical protein